MSAEKKKPNRKIRIIVGTSVLAFFVLAGTGAALAQNVRTEYKNKLLPHTTIGGVDVSGKTHVEAATILNNTFDAYLNTGFSFNTGKNTVRINRNDFGLNDPDASNDLIRLDSDTSINKAFANGHSGNILKDSLSLLRTYLASANFPLTTIVNNEDMESMLHKKLADIETPIGEPRLVWQNPNFDVKPGREGSIFDTKTAVGELQKQFANLHNNTIDIRTQRAAPTISDAEARSLAQSANEVVTQTRLTLTGNDEVFEIATSTRASWITIRKENGKTILDIDSDVLNNYVNSIASMVETPPQDAKFEIVGGRVAAFQNSRDGIKIDVDALRTALETAWIQKHASTISIPTAVEKAAIANEDANDLGIKEVLGVGISNYTGSTPSRIKNLKNALKKLNGMLIKPDEEFSLLAALKPFTAEGGWYPEKVIKGDQIKTEIGGGACQIGTTTFRAAMNSGLPITERQNHSLVVHYYNDPKNDNPGTDATIYDPAPDFKFKNDTGNHILFVAQIDEKKLQLTFTFYGTSDGRKGSYTAPLVSKWYPPGPKEQIRTTTLPPGKSECQNSFKGADASFTYTILKTDGEKVDRVFTSHYRALPVICMVGATPEDISAYGATILPGQPIPAAAPATSSTPAQTTPTPVTQ